MNIFADWILIIISIFYHTDINSIYMPMEDVSNIFLEEQTIALSLLIN